MRTDATAGSISVVNYKTKNKINYLIDCLLIITGIVMILSGLLVQARYHGRKMDPIMVSQIPDYIHWTQIHKISIVIITVLAFFHILFHLKWYKAVITKGLMNRNKLTISLSIVFFLAAITGFYAWFISMFNSGIAAKIEERHFIEIHDKLGILLAVLIILHVSKKLKWLINNSKKYIQSGQI